MTLSLDNHNIINQYTNWLKDNIKIKTIKNGYQFILPFLDNHNDHIEIYVINQGSNFILSDGGYIINDLEMSGVSFGTEFKQKLLEQILLRFGVKKEEDNTIFIEANSGNLAKKKHNLVQCILALNEMVVLNKESVKSVFYDDVLLALREKKIPFTSKITITGKGYNHSIDFIVPNITNGETLIKTTSKPTKDKLQPILFSFGDIKKAGREAKRNLIIYDGFVSELKDEDENAVKNYGCEIIKLEDLANYTF